LENYATLTSLTLPIRYLYGNRRAANHTLINRIWLLKMASISET
jgi:hypothetical protein